MARKPFPSEHPRHQVRKFVKQRCVMRPGKELTAAELYDVWARWAALRGLEPLARHVFGRYVSKLGLKTRKSGSTIYLGIMFRPDPRPRSARRRTLACVVKAPRASLPGS